MSRSLNKAILIGNVGGDPEVRTTSNGGRVASFSLATSRSWDDQGGSKQGQTRYGTEIRVRELMLLGGRGGGGGGSDEGGDMAPRRQPASSPRPKAAPAAGGGSFDVADFGAPDDDLPF